VIISALSISHYAQVVRQCFVCSVNVTTLWPNGSFSSGLNLGPVTVTVMVRTVRILCRSKNGTTYAHFVSFHIPKAIPRTEYFTQKWPLVRHILSPLRLYEYSVENLQVNGEQYEIIACIKFFTDTIGRVVRTFCTCMIQVGVYANTTCMLMLCMWE
jgi:hypothetical protein